MFLEDDDEEFLPPGKRARSTASAVGAGRRTTTRSLNSGKTNIKEYFAFLL